MADATTLHAAAVALAQTGRVTDVRVLRMAKTDPAVWNQLMVDAAVPTLTGYSSLLHSIGFDPLRLSAPAPVAPAAPPRPPLPPQSTQPSLARYKRGDEPQPKPEAPLVYDHTVDGLRGIPVTELASVSDKLGGQLATFGIRSLYDLISHVPLRYKDRSKAIPIRDCTIGDEVTFIATVSSSAAVTLGKRRGAKIVVRDATGSVTCTYFNAAWKADTVRFHDEVIVSGKLTDWIAPTGEVRLQMANPLLERTGSTTMPIIPIYPQSEKSKITTWQLYKAVGETVRRMGDLTDPVPANLVQGGPHIMGRADAYRLVHTPQHDGDDRPARSRLAYDELLRMQLALGMRRRAAAAHPSVEHRPTGQLTGTLIRSLPYSLTGDQKQALRDIHADLTGAAPGHRLVQGDVGCGKTLVAILAMLMAVEGGHQAALMAPTGVLAGQHYSEVSKQLEGVVKPDGSPVTVGLLSAEATGKGTLKKAITAGEVDIVVGTHALLSDDVTFHSLGLAVVDEQHRFGVDQRAALAAKAAEGKRADLLVMTATPIPRTAAMTEFGDLDMTVIREMPPGRTPVATSWEPVVSLTDETDPVWLRVRHDVAAGRQGYVVCPLVEDSETKAAVSAQATIDTLATGALRGLRLGLVHGKLSPAERDVVMERFTAGELDVLVATTVIEVGVNVPNATGIVILDPKNFGIAQLHQLRGRVGRGKHASWCVLAGEATTSDTEQRLEAIVHSTDGFWLSERDLVIRGPGAILGSRQHGMSDLRVADLARDHDLLALARDDAARILDSDPTLMRWNVLRHEVASALDGDAEHYLTAS